MVPHPKYAKRTNSFFVEHKPLATDNLVYLAPIVCYPNSHGGLSLIKRVDYTRDITKPAHRTLLSIRGPHVAGQKGKRRLIGGLENRFHRI
jgi:hypothetical protein